MSFREERAVKKAIGEAAELKKLIRERTRAEGEFKLKSALGREKLRIKKTKKPGRISGFLKKEAKKGLIAARKQALKEGRKALARRRRRKRKAMRKIKIRKKRR